MKKIFLDTNVVIDFLIDRKPFSHEATILFEYSRRGKLKLYVSSLSISNIHYIISQLETKKKAITLVHRLLPLIEILPVGRKIVEKAAISKFKDFEDALQNYCAEGDHQTVIVTRNIKDFKQSKLSIQTPKEFLKTIL